MTEEYDEQLTIKLMKEISPLRAAGVILLVSGLAVGFLFWLIYFKGGSDSRSAWVGSLPALNAMLNGTSAVLLLFGYRAILRRQFLSHMRFNLTALLTSTLFLISYVIYHNFQGHTPFPGEGMIRPVYFFLLITHIILSALLLPMVLGSFYLAFSGRFGLHRRYSRITLPVWLYVSVTGVLIFLILNSYV